MNTCATCRHSSKGHGVSVYVESEDDYVESEHLTCVRIIHGNGINRSAGVLREPAVVTDGSGYAARLLVLPTFGCILHETKKAP